MCTALSPGNQLGLSARSCQHYPSQAHIWAAQLPSQRMGYMFLPILVPSGLSDPQVLWGKWKLQVMLLVGQQVRWT